MEETRKYFDYELAYEMYKKCKDLLEQGGMESLENEFEEVADRENGYTSFYGADYNTWVYVCNENFDTNKQPKWYVSGEVDLISYSGGDDTIYINDNNSITDRIMGLVDYARKNDYTLDDLYKEYDSLKSVLGLITEKLDEENNEFMLCNNIKYEHNSKNTDIIVEEV